MCVHGCGKIVHIKNKLFANVDMHVFFNEKHVRFNEMHDVHLNEKHVLVNDGPLGKHVFFMKSTCFS